MSLNAMHLTNTQINTYTYTHEHTHTHVTYKAKTFIHTSVQYLHLACIEIVPKLDLNMTAYCMQKQMQYTSLDSFGINEIINFDLIIINSK